MKNILIFILVSSGLSLTSVAMAECTQETLEEKVPDAMIAIQSIADKDPGRGQELAIEMQKIALKMQEMQSTENTQEACEFYDMMIEEANR